MPYLYEVIKRTGKEIVIDIPTRAREFTNDAGRRVSVDAGTIHLAVDEQDLLNADPGSRVAAVPVFYPTTVDLNQVETHVHVVRTWQEPKTASSSPATEQAQ